MYENNSKRYKNRSLGICRSRVCTALVCGALIHAFSSAAFAASFPPSEKVFPTTTRAWLSIPDLEGLQKSFERTHYGQLLQDPTMKPFIESLRDQMRTAGKQRLEKLGLTLDDLEKIPGGEIAIAAIEPQPGVLATVLLVDTTGHEAETRELIDTISERLVARKATLLGENKLTPQVTTYLLPERTEDAASANSPAAAVAPRKRQVAIAQGTSALVVGDDPVTVAQVLGALTKGRVDCLATLQSFDAVGTQCCKDMPARAAPLRWFIDPFGYAKLYQAANPSREKRKGPDYVAILGRQGFDAIQGAGGIILFDDGAHEICYRSMVYAPPLEGRKPFAADRFDRAARMLHFPDSDTIDPPQWAPRKLAGWTAMQWDIQAAFASAESLVDDIVGEKGVFDDVIASLKEDPDGPQIDVEKDLVACLGKRMSIISDYVTPIDTDSERLVIAIETIDAQRVSETVAKSMATDPDMKKVDFNGHVIWELIDRSAAIPALEIETPGGSVIHADADTDTKQNRPKLRERDEKLLPHSAVTVAKGHLLIASHRDFLEKVLLTSGGEESLASTVDYEAMHKELNLLFPGPTCMRSFGRVDESIHPAYEMFRQGSMPKSKSLAGQLLNGILGDGKEKSERAQKIDGSKLPEFASIERYFGTICMGMQSLPNGWYMAGVALPKIQQEQEQEQEQKQPVPQ